LAKHYDLKIDKGSIYTRRVLVLAEDGVTPRNLTGYTAKLHIKKHPDDAVPVAQFAIGSGLSITALTGIVTIDLSDAVTVALDFRSGVYDLLIISSSNVAERILQGGVVLSEAITVE
jgi:hypothetical protein